MATLTVIDPDLNGEAVVPAAAAVAGDVFAATAVNDYLVHVRNGHSSSQSVTFNDPTSTSPADAVAFNPDVTVAVPATSEKLIRVRASRFRDTNGQIAMTYTGVTLLTLNVYNAG